MPISPSRAPRDAFAPQRVYCFYAFSFSLLFQLTSVLNLVYMATEVGLSPFQMVVVGAVLEASVFVFEIPTGVVADLYSRRLSVLIGLVLIGAGFVLQGVGATFAAMLIAQVIWGVGYTFTSGADRAWLADEIGAQNVAPVFARAQQLRLGGTIVGTLSAGSLGLIDIQLPLIASGAGYVVLAAALAVTMSERGFAPTRAQERETFAHMGQSLREGIAVARTRPVARAMLIIALLSGLASEAVDRLWTVRVLQDFDLPGLSGSDNPAVLFAAISLIGAAIALGVSLVVNALALERVNDLHPNRLLALLVGVEVAGVAGLALSGALWVALAGLWARNAAVALAEPIQSAWLNRTLDSRTRATSLSLNGQADAIGQVIGGPPLGALGDRAGVPAALLASAAILAPSAAIYGRLRPPEQADDDEPAATPSA